MNRNLTAEEYRAMADDCHKSKIESFERCDTDGFLSQWASDVMARQYQLAAELAERDWKDCWETLADAEGNLVPCREIETKYGMAYAVYATYDDAKNCGEIIKWVGKGKRAAQNKGYQIVVVQAEANITLSKGYAPFAYTYPIEPVFTPENCEIVK